MPEHRSLDAAIAWVNATTESLDREDVPLPTARGRVLAEAIHALGPIPGDNRAALDGFAVEASASSGASSYNPIRQPLICVAAGDVLPAGTDAVVPRRLAEPAGEAYIEIVEAVAAGDNVSGVPVVLLPGAPASCLWAYELFAGRAIRRLGGRAAELPYRSREMIAGRKIVSSLGMTEICPVRFVEGDAIEPLPSFAEIGLMAAVGADGFVIVPQGSEGYARGARTTVYLYDEC